MDAPFRPHPLLPGGHPQTFAGALLPTGAPPYAARQHVIDVPGGDRTVLHDDRPADWHEGGTAVLLYHGLTGDHASPYMVRIAALLEGRGVRVFRLDARGWGAGERLARQPSNAGRSEDTRAGLHAVAGLCPGSPLGVAGFSLGANVVLKMLAEAALGRPAEGADGSDLPPLHRAVAVAPPIDLAATADALGRGFNRVYDARFTRGLVRRIALLRRTVPGIDWPDLPRPPRSVREFDDLFTAPRTGYRDADEYYARCSAGPLLDRITTRTLLLAADDDPLVPAEMFARYPLSSAIRLEIVRGGGHLGFVSRDSFGAAGHRWMDARVADWLGA